MSLPPMARTILVYAGWFALPNWATGVTVVLVNRILSQIKPNYSPPVKGSSRAVDQWRYSYAFVMLSYLATTTIHACLSMPLNFYEILGVGPDADDQALKAAFRSFARRNHPDRVGSKGAPLFIAVRDAFEALNHPVKRFAYDRFGPEAMTWKDCATPREYLRHGLLASSGFYLGTVAFLLLWSFLGTHNTGAYWRNLLFFTLFFLEFSLIVNSPSSGTGDKISLFPLSILFPRRVPYQHTLFLHQLYMSLSIAISRVVPVLFPNSREFSRSEDLTMSAVKPIVDKLAFLATTADRELSRMLSAEIRSMHGPSALPLARQADSAMQGSSAHVSSEDPFVPSESTLEALTTEMENLFIDKQLQSHPLLRGYWEEAVARRREAQEAQGQTEVVQPRSTVAFPSPPRSLSPIEMQKELVPSVLDRVEKSKLSLQNIPNTRKLPNPLPSPPRDIQQSVSQPVGIASGPGYVRGRSCSY